MKNKQIFFAIFFCVLFAGKVIAQIAEQPEMNSQKSVTEELKDLEDKSSKRIPPEVLEAGRKGEAEIAASGILKTALNVGAKMPDFSLKDAAGKTIKSEDLLKEGNLIIVFYRGAWCPYCNLYLRGLQKYLPRFRENGGNLVAISGENPDNSLSVEKKNNLEFKVLSDPDFQTARKFGIVYQVPKPIDEVARGYGLDFKNYYKTEMSELPLSATYVINREGKIVYAFLEPDYKKRADPEKIILVLKEINK